MESGFEIIGLNVYQTEASQKQINAFKLSSKSVLHYLVLLAVLTVPLFIIVTLVFCIKTPILRRRWLWILFILLGIGSFSFNWTNGHYEFRILSVYLFGAAARAAETL